MDGERGGQNGGTGGGTGGGRTRQAGMLFPTVFEEGQDTSTYTCTYSTYTFTLFTTHTLSFYMYSTLTPLHSTLSVFPSHHSKSGRTPLRSPLSLAVLGHANPSFSPLNIGHADADSAFPRGRRGSRRSESPFCPLAGVHLGVRL